MTFYMSKFSGGGHIQTDLKMKNAPENLKTPISYLHVVLPELKCNFIYLPINLALFTPFPSMKLYFKVQVLMGMRAKGPQYPREKTIQWKDIAILESKQRSSLLPYSEGKTHIDKVEHNHKLGVWTPVSETEPPEWEGGEGHVSSPRSELWELHTLPSLRSMGALPPQGVHSHSEGTPAWSSLRIQILPQFFKPLSGSQNPWSSHFLNVQKLYLRAPTLWRAPTQNSNLRSKNVWA